MPSKSYGPVPDPVEVEVKKAAKTFRISWADDHTSLYDFRYLRGFCPCAHCQGHGVGWEWQENDGPDVIEVHEVGNYALNLVFADKHRTGIYSFEILRKLCPCDACKAEWGPVHPTARMP